MVSKKKVKPVARVAKPAKRKAAAKSPAARKPAPNRRAKPPAEQRLAEALEQQAATAEILRVISSSRTDAQPVFETIAANALHLCDAVFSLVFRFDGDLIHIAALHNVTPEGVSAFRRAFPQTPGRGGATQRAILTRSIVHIPDICDDPEYVYQEDAQKADYRSILSVPMLREGQPLGAITVFRAAARSFPDAQIELLKTFADQAVIAVENVRLFTELEARNHDLTEGLEQQTATSDILRVISQSQTDVQPVFDTIAAAALKLCRASSTNVVKYDGEWLQIAALASWNAEGADALRSLFPRRADRETAVSRAVMTRTTVAIPDVLEDAEYGIRPVALAGGYRSTVAVPLLRDGSPIGGIAVVRPEPGPFPDKQIALLQTFADQAVIAIENVRLFTELEARNADLTEALEQKTATSDILRVISQSPTDVQPIFDTIAVAALKLCSANSSNVFTSDGKLVDVVALANVNPKGVNAVRRSYPRPIGRDNAAGRAVLTCKLVTIPDILKDPEYGLGDTALTAGFRSILAVPLIREGSPIGAIAVGRAEPGPFPDTQIALLQTFADQAVIAIENVRLFTELQARNRDLTDALEQQTATSDILRAISRSQTDAQPVFETIAAHALKLCNAGSATVSRFDGEMVHLAAIAVVDPQGEDAVRRLFPRPPSPDITASRCILMSSVVAIPDVLEDPDFVDKASALAGGFRSTLAVPLIYENNPIGAITVGRPEAGPFPDEQIRLLQTFADQAVIAIENVRLFTELQARNADLTEALEHQTATSEILRVISSSPNDVQPVFDIIGERATRLCDAEIGLVSRVEGDRIHLVALHGVSREGTEAIGRYFPMSLDAELTTARAIRSRNVVHTFDVLADPKYEAKDAAVAGAYRSVLAVPMFREAQVIGAIFVARADPGRFADSKVELLKTFADQAVIAIENVRLFNELKTRTAQLTRSVDELRALGEVGQAVSSTLDLEIVLRTIVSRATQLAGVDAGAIYEYDEVREEFYLRAMDQFPDDLVEALRARPIRKGEGALGRLAVVHEPVQIRDIKDETIYQSGLRETLIRLGYRSLLAVPLLRENHLIGGLVANRKVAGDFAPHVIDLLKTFATQSALAIQNARLFREIEDKSRQLEVASQHKSEFLANMSHELRTPLNAIIGFSEVLSERMFGEINDKQAEYLSDILESGRHLLSLINDILDLSKIEAGRMELNLSDFNLPTAIDNTMMLLRERAHRREIALGCVVDEQLGGIRADERKVKQVLLNLLSNALKFTPDGGRIDVRARPHDDHVEISVRDTGVGIAPEDQQAVFEEFRQVGATAKKVEGTGLGLAISRKFIELHGGRIWVESQVGKGSTFVFTVPLTIDPAHRTS